MAVYMVRTNCEYSVAVEATNGEAALEHAGAFDVNDWPGKAWAPMTVEDGEGASAEMTAVKGDCPECGYALGLHGQPRLHLPCSREAKA